MSASDTFPPVDNRAMPIMPTQSHHFEPKRLLGRTGFTATALGIGDLADRAVPIEQCVATAKRAIEAGLNLIDTAPNYEEGYSEQIVGRAVKGVRDRMFVIMSTCSSFTASRRWKYGGRCRRREADLMAWRDAPKPASCVSAESPHTTRRCCASRSRRAYATW
jgi:aryl-alcohol dehydrogenase-like predicted oxidoreductase